MVRGKVFTPEEVTDQTNRYLSTNVPTDITVNTNLARAGMDCIEKVPKKDIWNGSVIGSPGDRHKLKYFPKE